MPEYYVLTKDPCIQSVFEFIQHNDLNHEIHFNRTRFWVPQGPILTEFHLRFADHCPLVEPKDL